MFHHIFRLSSPGGGYAYYGEGHRLPGIFYLQFNFLSLVLAALTALAILVVLLPALHRKLPTLLLGVTAILSGTVAGYGLIIPEWQVGFMELTNKVLTYKQTQYAQLMNHPVSTQVGLRIGLTGANFTLVHEVQENLTFYWDERVEFDTLEGMANQFRDSLQRGLPVAVLELQEQVVGNGEDGFMWPFQLRQAGYYCSWLLVAAISVWAITCLLLIAVPKIGAASLALTGMLLISVPLLYISLVPSVAGPARQLRVAGRTMPLKYGPCMWSIVAGGLWTTAVGLTLYFYHRNHPNRFFTDLDMDYDDNEHVRRRTLIEKHLSTKSSEDDDTESIEFTHL